MKYREKLTSSVFCGPPAILWRIVRPCRDGTPPMRTGSRAFSANAVIDTLLNLSAKLSSNESYPGLWSERSQFPAVHTIYSLPCLKSSDINVLQRSSRGRRNLHRNGHRGCR